MSTQQPMVGPGFQVVSVGKLLPGGRTRYPEGAVYDYGPAGHQILACYGSPTRHEVGAFRKGQITWAVRSYPGLTALYFRPAPMDWQEAYFELRRVADPEWRRQLESGAVPLGPAQRSDGTWEVDTVTVIMVDAHTGVVTALRVVAPPRTFMKCLADSIRSQVQGPLPPQEEVTSTLRRLARQTPSELGAAALAQMHQL